MSSGNGRRDGRLHLRVPEELKQKVQDYAHRHNTTVTNLVTRFFTRLLEEEERRKTPDAEQV